MGEMMLTAKLRIQQRMQEESTFLETLSLSTAHTALMGLIVTA
jgi:hypothetical protein